MTSCTTSRLRRLATSLTMQQKPSASLSKGAAFPQRCSTRIGAHWSVSTCTT